MLLKRRYLAVLLSVGVLPCALASETELSEAQAGMTQSVSDTVAIDPVVASSDDDEYLEDNEIDEDMMMRPRIQKLLSGAKNYADNDQPADAIAQLDKLKRMDLRTQEQIMLYNTYAYVYFSQDDYDNTIKAYEQQIAFDKIEPELKRTTLSSLAQLKMQKEDYDGSLQHLTEWFELTETPSPEIYLFKSQLLFQKGQYTEAAKTVDEAVAVRNQQAKDAGKKPTAIPEQWLLMKRSIYFKAENYTALEGVLKTLILNYPKTEYWTQLSAVYNQLGRGERELASMEAAYLGGGFKKENEIKGYAQILMANNLPYKAAQVMSNSLANQSLKESADNYAMLSDAWLLAKEYDSAIEALRKAASLSKTGELDSRLAQILLDRKQYQAAIEAAQAAVKKPNKEAGLANLVAGMSHYYLDQLEPAKKAFERAKESKKTAKPAEQWIQQIDDLLARKKEIEAYLNQ